MIYHFECYVYQDTFLSWEAGQVSQVWFGNEVDNMGEGIWKHRSLPVPYVRLIAQFITEVEHGNVDRGHESRRRWSYAKRMLNTLGEELDSMEECGAHFRSKVLTPVLVRQIWGVSDGYTPGVRAAVEGPSGKLTIYEAASFYLREDPIDPKFKEPFYRNLIYTREVRWHLGRVLLGRSRDVATFNATIDNQEYLMHWALVSAMQTSQTPIETDGPPPFTVKEVKVMVAELINPFFEKDIKDLVRIGPHSPTAPSIPGTESPWVLQFFRLLPSCEKRKKRAVT
jgi:hypothetical protein